MLHRIKGVQLASSRRDTPSTRPLAPHRACSRRDFSCKLRLASFVTGTKSAGSKRYSTAFTVATLLQEQDGGNNAAHTQLRSRREGIVLSLSEAVRRVEQDLTLPYAERRSGFLLSQGKRAQALSLLAVISSSLRSLRPRCIAAPDLFWPSCPGRPQKSSVLPLLEGLWLLLALGCDPTRSSSFRPLFLWAWYPRRGVQKDEEQRAPSSTPNIHFANLTSSSSCSYHHAIPIPLSPPSLHPQHLSFCLRPPSSTRSPRRACIAPFLHGQALPGQPSLSPVHRSEAPWTSNRPRRERSTP